MNYLRFSVTFCKCTTFDMKMNLVLKVGFGRATGFSRLASSSGSGFSGWPRLPGRSNRIWRIVWVHQNPFPGQKKRIFMCEYWPVDSHDCHNFRRISRSVANKPLIP